MLPKPKLSISLRGLLIIVIASGLCFFYYSLYGSLPSLLWNEKKHFRRHGAEFKIESSGKIHWTSLTWDVKFTGKFPTSDYSSGEIEMAANDKVSEIMDRLHFSILTKQINSSKALDSPLNDSDSSILTYEEIKNLHEALAPGVFLSIKAVGKEPDLRSCPLSLTHDDNLKSYVFDDASNLKDRLNPNTETGRVQFEKNFQVSTFLSNPALCKHHSHNKALVLQIPRLEQISLPAHCSWLRYLTWSCPRVELSKMCSVVTSRGDEHGIRLVPKVFLSFLFCY